MMPPVYIKYYDHLMHTQKRMFLSRTDYRKWRWEIRKAVENEERKELHWVEIDRSEYYRCDPID